MIFANLKELAKENKNFRHVIFTATHSQIVLMSLLPGEETGEETHITSDQILIIIKGEGKAFVNNETAKIEKNSVVYVPTNTKHNIINKGNEDMKLYTIYAPSVHTDGIIQRTKADTANEEKE